MEAKSQRSDPPSSSSSSLLKDISNFKTPKNPKRFRNFNNNCLSPYSQSKYFTASRQTPLSSAHRGGGAGTVSSAARSKAARRLKAFELEQVKSARKAQIEKENSLKSLAKSLTVWLNFLFENPSSCGCDVSRFTGEVGRFGGPEVKENGKRESGLGREVGVDGGPWRGPKRQRGLSWMGNGNEETSAKAFSGSMVSALKDSLKEICSFEDLKERMRVYLSLGSCKEIFETMAQVTKSIDEGRLKMRPHCPIVTDVGMKEKAIKILMSCNPIWLRIGLYIVLGGDSLLPNGDVNSEQEIAFLRIVIEKQFFSHAGLAKIYSYNKLVEGLYRPGYFEKLGNVILKRFLLLVLILDRAKSQSSLPLKHGIDGLDGGSPLVFSLQSNIKSSRQLINDFLSSDVMHGEGNIVAHLVIIGYKVSYQQIPLTEYEFRVTDLFEDLRDGVQLCRAIHLLQHDSSILMKMVVPSDSRKKSLVNCGIALRYLKQAAVPSCDEDGTAILGEDIVNGEKELILSLLWDMFVHLQLPLLVNKQLLADEIIKIQGVVQEYSSSCTLLDMLLSWIQAICRSYDFNIEAFSSLVDGKAMWCLLDYYFRKEHRCSTSFKVLDDSNGEVSIVSPNDYTDAVHNFILSQKLTSLLGKFPEVLQMSDLLEHNGACSDRGVVILLVFLSFQLLVKRNTDQLNFHKLLGFDCQSPERRRLSTERWFMQSDAVLNVKEMHQDNAAVRNFKAIMAWWQDMARRNQKCEPYVCSQPLLTGKSGKNIERENAARIIQSHFRRSVERCRYLKMKNAVRILQSVIQAWLFVKKSSTGIFSRSELQESLYARVKHAENSPTYMTFLFNRHDFVNSRKSAITIQRAIRARIARRRNSGNAILKDISNPDAIKAAIIIRKFFCGWKAKSVFVHEVAQAEEAAVASKEIEADCSYTKAANKIQRAFRQFIVHRTLLSRHSAATKIQCVFRGWQTRKSFLDQRQAVLTIQSVFRCIRCWSQFEQYKQECKSAIIIQSHFRGWIARRAAHWQRCCIIKLQSHCRGWLMRKELLAKKEAVTRIQSWFHYIKFRKTYLCHRHAAIQIQCFVKGRITRKRLLGASCYHKFLKDRSKCFGLKIYLQCVLKLQRWWRRVLLLESKTRSAVVIQSHFRGWIARRVATKEKKCIVVIQSHCRVWLMRKELLAQKEAVTRIQSCFHCMRCQKAYLRLRHAATQIQCFARGEITRKRLLGASCYPKFSRDGLQRLELKTYLQCIVKLQRWWRVVLLKLKTRSAIIIQSYFRAWIARKIATKEKKSIVVIQAYWKGYLARKNSKEHLLDLRLRVQKSAANVDDKKRLINRLLVALSELLSMRSVRGILHTCATLDMATEHSQRCCEELVAAGAVATLLQLLRSVSRSIPDQEVLKHALSTLRNLARYPHLTEVLIDTRGLVETILWELVRNKDGFFIASELLKRICINRKGVEAVYRLPALVKRLHNLVEELARKAGNDNRSAQGVLAREQIDRRIKEANDRRLKEATAVLELVMNI